MKVYACNIAMDIYCQMFHLKFTCNSVITCVQFESANFTNFKLSLKHHTGKFPTLKHFLCKCPNIELILPLTFNFSNFLYKFLAEILKQWFQYQEKICRNLNILYAWICMEGISCTEILKWILSLFCFSENIIYRI